MLSHEDNETLVRVGPGTPMGQLMRLYWIPFLPSKDLAADGQPQRVRLLGEDLLAFRDSEGRIGLIDHACAHRGAPLVFGRNEDCGLRCIYHGWKFGIDGRVRRHAGRAGREPASRRTCASRTIRCRSATASPGPTWAPDRDSPPPLPNMEWNLVPEENVHVSFRVQECNWLQAVEGEIDSAHARDPARPHRRAGRDQRLDRRRRTCARRSNASARTSASASPRAACSTRTTHYWRVNQFLLPFYTLVPPQSQYPELSGHAWVPMDDEHTLCIMFSYHPTQKFYEKTRELFEQRPRRARDRTSERQCVRAAAARPSPTRNTGPGST